MAGCKERSKLSFDDDTYELINVHLHSVSEHSVSVLLRYYIYYEVYTRLTGSVCDESSKPSGQGSLIRFSCVTQQGLT